MSALLLSITGCDNGSADNVRFKALNESVTRAMCVPYGRERINALDELVEAYREHYTEDGPTSGDLVGDLAIDVSPDDCVKAGYGNPGPPIKMRPRPRLPLKSEPDGNN